MKLRKVPPREIKIPELRVRAAFESEIYEQFQHSVKEAGILAPVIVCEVGEDLVLVDGAHRIEEAIANGIKLIDVVVFAGDMTDVLTKNLFLDHTRGKTPIGDMIRVVGALFTEYGMDPEKIREKTGLTRDYIEKLIKISTAAPSVLQALDAGVIGVGHAFELCRLPYAIQQEEILAKHQIWRFTVKDLREQIDAVLEAIREIQAAPPPEAPGEPPPPMVYHCEGCKTETEPRYLRPVMICPNCFGELWRLSREADVRAMVAAKLPEGA